jgi:hypothetical protein
MQRHPFVICDAGRQGGKSTFASRGLIFPEWIRWKETTSHAHEWPRKILLIAPQIDQAEIIFSEVADLADERGIPLKRDQRSGKFDLITPDGSRLRCMSGMNPKAMRGYQWHYVVIDEGASVIDLAKIIDSVLKPTLIARYGKLLIIGSVDFPGSFTDLCAMKGRDPSIRQWGHVLFTSLENTFIPQMRDFLLDEIESGTPLDIIKREYFAVRVPRSGLVYDITNAVMDEAEIRAVEENIANGKFHRATDFGFQNPHACITHLQMGENLYAWDEYYATHRTIEEHAEAYVGFDRKYDYQVNVCDLESPDSIKFFSNFKYEDGKFGMKRLKGQWILKGTKPPVIERIDLLRTWIAKGKYRIHPRCRQYIAELGLESYPDGREAVNAGEKPIDKDNHGSSASGYLLYYLFGKPIGSKRIVLGGERDSVKALRTY